MSFINRFRRQYLENHAAVIRRQKARRNLCAAGIILSAVVLYCAIAAGYSGSKIRITVYVVDSGCTFMSEGEE